MRLNPKTNSCFDASDHVPHKPDVHSTPDNDASALMSTTPPSSNNNSRHQFAGDGEALY